MRLNFYEYSRDSQLLLLLLSSSSSSPLLLVSASSSPSSSSSSSSVSDLAQKGGLFWCRPGIVTSVATKLFQGKQVCCDTKYCPFFRCRCHKKQLPTASVLCSPSGNHGLQCSTRRPKGLLAWFVKAIECFLLADWLFSAFLQIGKQKKKRKTSWFDFIKRFFCGSCCGFCRILKFKCSGSKFSDTETFKCLFSAASLFWVKVKVWPKFFFLSHNFFAFNWTICAKRFKCKLLPYLWKLLLSFMESVQCGKWVSARVLQTEPLKAQKKWQ